MIKEKLRISGLRLSFELERDFGIHKICLPKTCYAWTNCFADFSPVMWKKLVRCPTAHRSYDHASLWGWWSWWGWWGWWWFIKDVFMASQGLVHALLSMSANSQKLKKQIMDNHEIRHKRTEISAKSASSRWQNERIKGWRVTKITWNRKNFLHADTRRSDICRTHVRKYEIIMRECFSMMS